KLPRCLLANTWTDAPFLEGVRVNDDARDIVNAVRRVRALTSDRDTVLVLPEDPMLVAWIGRRRPALCGGIVTLDQYPDRCRVAAASRGPCVAGAFGGIRGLNRCSLLASDGSRRRQPAARSSRRRAWRPRTSIAGRPAALWSPT